MSSANEQASEPVKVKVPADERRILELSSVLMSLSMTKIVRMALTSYLNIFGPNISFDEAAKTVIANELNMTWTRAESFIEVGEKLVSLLNPEVKLPLTQAQLNQIEETWEKGLALIRKSRSSLSEA